MARIWNATKKLLPDSKDIFELSIACLRLLWRVITDHLAALPDTLVEGHIEKLTKLSVKRICILSVRLVSSDHAPDTIRWEAFSLFAGLMGDPFHSSSDIPGTLVRKGLYLPLVQVALQQLKAEGDQSNRELIIMKTHRYWASILMYDYDRGTGSNPAVPGMIRDGIISCIGRWILSEELSSEFHEKNGRCMARLASKHTQLISSRL